MMIGKNGHDLYDVLKSASQKLRCEKKQKQMSAYLNAGLPEEKAWELVKMEVAKDVQES